MIVCVDRIIADCSLPPVRSRRRGATERWGFVVPQGRERMMGYGRFEDVINALEGAVSQSEYLVGDSFTAADVYVGSGIDFGMQFGAIG